MKFSYKLMTLFLLMSASNLMQANSSLYKQLELLQRGYKYAHDTYFPVRGLTGYLVGFSSVMSLTSGIECITTMGENGKARFLFGLLGLGISMAAESTKPDKWGLKSFAFSSTAALGALTALVKVPYTRAILEAWGKD